LRKEAYTAVKKMFTAAEKDGVKLKILSATRNFTYQKRIWLAKWLSAPNNKIKDTSKRAEAILEYSAMPGSSRHHWGTDIDLNSLNGGDFESGVGLKIYTWLSENASTYGFCQPYSKKGKTRPTGYNEEKWHWSYLPIAQKLTEVARKKLKNEMITGFLGAEAAVKLDVVNNYVLGINKDCVK
jgi:zinc D-Ala-D-Ala carboxypeptidase